MSSARELDNLSHRSRERVRDLGEVFTPESYVEKMLDLLTKNNKQLWTDEDVVFFEPSCGHGNIVVPIYERRLEALYKKALGHSIKDAHLYAIANALNTLWAIDIDSRNINQCRTRVLVATLDFFIKKEKSGSISILLSENREFVAHILCSIKWQIHENETLSALSDKKSALSSSCLTNSGAKWFARNKHHPIDFENNWATYYSECEEGNLTSIEFENSKNCLNKIIKGNENISEEFSFAKILIQMIRRELDKKTREVTVE